MTNQEYFQRLLNAQLLTALEVATLRGLVSDTVAKLVQLEGNPMCFYGGSFSKGTVIRERYDLDLVIYWPHDSKFTIEGIYNGVGTQLKTIYKFVNSKTVAWEIPFQEGFHIDVVPGRALDRNFFETNLYRTDTGTTLKTSLKTHIDTVKDSGRTDIVRLLKLWRERKKIPFKKSFLLELMTIRGCSGLPSSNIESQLMQSFRYIRDNISTAQIKDPANSNNSLSDDISASDKSCIATAAQAALDAKYWSNVFE